MLPARIVNLLQGEYASIGVALVGVGLAVALQLVAREREVRRSLSRAARYFALYLVLRGAMAGLAAIREQQFELVLRVFASIAFLVGAIRLLESLFFDFFLRLRRHIEPPRILRDVVDAVLWIAGLLFVLGAAFGVRIGPLLTTSAIITAVVGLALQETLGNVFAGLSLQVEKPFAVGDQITVNDVYGEVVQMTWRSTKIRTEAEDVLIVPNGVIARAQVVNHRRPRPATARFVTVGVSYDTPPVVVKRALIEAAHAEPRVRTRPAPTARLRSFDESAVSYELQFFLDDIENYRDAEDRVRTAIWYRLRRDGIDIPYPTRTVHMAQPAPQRSAPLPAQRHSAGELKDRLRGIDFLAPLGEDDLERLAESSRTEMYAPGEIVVREGDPGDSAYVLLEGTVAIRLEQASLVEAAASARGDETTGSAAPKGPFAISASAPRLHPGAFFGEMSLLTDEPRSATVIAETSCEVLVIDRPIFREVLAGNELLAARMSEILVRRQAELDTKRGATHAPGAVEAQTTALLARIRGLFGF